MSLRPRLRSSHLISQARFASRIHINHRPPFPVISTCPSPTCPCAETPSGLDIDRVTPLNGTAPAYSEQLLLSTGHANWPSNLEDDPNDAAIAGFKSLFGRGGKYLDPYHKILVTNSSLIPAPHPSQTQKTTSAYLFPSFKYISHLPTSAPSLDLFTRAFLLPQTLHPETARSHPDTRHTLTRAPELQKHFPDVRDVDEILVLICGHGNRDSRCGILGPILAAEFREKLVSAGISVVEPVESNPTESTPAESTPAESTPAESTPAESTPVDSMSAEIKSSPRLSTAPNSGLRARVGLISHIGGHKFAGNVIIYLPLGLRLPTRDTAAGSTMAASSLAGMGIWYGRVEPGHVQGLVQKCVLGGRVVMDLFRGGIGPDGRVLRA